MNRPEYRLWLEGLGRMAPSEDWRECLEVISPEYARVMAKAERDGDVSFGEIQAAIAKDRGISAEEAEQVVLEMFPSARDLGSGLRENRC